MANNWNLTRWWVTPNSGYSDGGTKFKFLNDNTISCSYWIADASTRFTNGTYSIRRDKVYITLIKDITMRLDATLVFAPFQQKLLGIYTLQLLSISNPPVSYTTKTITGDMKTEIMN